MYIDRLIYKKIMKSFIDIKKPNRSDDNGFPLGVRHVQAWLLFLLLAIGIGTRTQLSVAIVAMTDNTTSSNPNIPTYDWTNKSVILSSFYWGYLILQIIAGAASDKFSTKIYLLISVAGNTASCFFVPIAAAKLGSKGVMVCRIIQGISQGGLYPSVYVLLGRWAPLNERSRLSAIALGGSSFGTIITLPLVGYMSSTWIGWPSTFYLYGSLGVAWILLFYIFGADSPQVHKTISYEERNYIEESLNTNEKEEKQKLLPIKPILTSFPFWVLTLVHIGSTWGHTTISNEMPDYLSKVMKFDIKSDGLLSSLPSVVSFFSHFAFGAMADYIINRHYLTRTVTRRVFTLFGNGMSAVFLLTLAFLPNNSNILSVIMLVLADSVGSATIGGSSVNHIDLSPKFSGFIMSITNTLSNGIGLVAPLVVQAIVTDETVKSQWTIIFVISAALNLSMTFFYSLFASADLQWWNYYGSDVRSKSDLTNIEHMANKISKTSDLI